MGGSLSSSFSRLQRYGWSLDPWSSTRNHHGAYRNFSTCAHAYFANWCKLRIDRYLFRPIALGIGGRYYFACGRLIGKRSSNEYVANAA
jgi:hypothetical protein